MLNNNFTILNNFIKLNLLNTSVSMLEGSMSNFNNMDFCNKILNKTKGQSNDYGFYNSATLIYISPKEEDEQESDNGSNVIVNLLMQMKATQNDKNNIINNKVVLKNQIMGQLERELMFGNHNLSKDQIKKIKSVVSNNYNDKNFSKVINSVSKTLKKKVTHNVNLHNKNSVYLQNNFNKTKLLVGNISKKYDVSNNTNRAKIINNVSLEPLKKESITKDNKGLTINNEIQYNSFTKGILKNVYLDKFASITGLSKVKTPFEYIINKNIVNETIGKNTNNNVFSNRFITSANLVNIEKNEQNNTEDYLSNKAVVNNIINKVSKKLDLNHQESIIKANLINSEKIAKVYLNKTKLDNIMENELSLNKQDYIIKANLINSEKGAINYLNKTKLDNIIINKINRNLILNSIKNNVSLVNIEKSKENYLSKHLFASTQNIFNLKDFRNISRANLINIQENNLENIINKINNDSYIENFKNIKTTNLNIEKNVASYLNKSLSKKVINRLKIQENIEKYITRDNYKNLVNNIDSNNFTNRIIKTTNLINKINNNHDSFEDIFYSKNIIEKILNISKLNELSKNVINKNNIYKSKNKFKLDNTFNIDNSTTSNDSTFTNFKYLINNNQPSKIGFLNNLISAKADDEDILNSNVKPLKVKKLKLNTKEVVQDLLGASKVYYNDAVEQIGQNFTVLDTNVRNEAIRSTGPLSHKQKFVYKSPIKLPQADESDSFKQSEDVLKSQIENASSISNQFEPESTSFVEQKDPAKQSVTREEAKEIVKEYISDLNIDTKVISRKVMDEIERMLKTERRRFGITS